MSGPHNLNHTYNLTTGKQKNVIISGLGRGGADNYVVDSSKKNFQIIDPHGDSDRLNIILGKNESVFFAGEKGDSLNPAHIEIRNKKGKVLSSIYCKGVEDILALKKAPSGKFEPVDIQGEIVQQKKANEPKSS